MKPHCEPDLDFQEIEIEAVCGLFRGRNVRRTEFTVTRDLSMPVFRDNTFANGAAKTNFAAILEQWGCENVRSL